MALSYSGRQDLTLAVQEIARLAAGGQLHPAEVTPELVAAHLATRTLPPAWQTPDLVVRTSGERRLSNFMLWECAYSGALRPWLTVVCRCSLFLVAPWSYGPADRPAHSNNQVSLLPGAELFFTDVMWPDFGEQPLAAALQDYAQRERRYGGRRHATHSIDNHSSSTSGGGGGGGSADAGSGGSSAAHPL